MFQQTPSLASLHVCRGGGCYAVDNTQITQTEWAKIAAIFNPKSSSAEQERERLQSAIGLFEQIIGAKIGTSDDRAGTFHNKPGQQDCNDEAVNATTYLKLLQQNGLLKFHTIGDLRTRNFFLTGWPHTTASIIDNKTDTAYAVDGWFYDNGHDAVVMPIKAWRDFKPKDSPIYQ